MANKTQTSATVAIPSGITVKIDGQRVSAQGPKGKCEKVVPLGKVQAKVNGNNVELVGTLREANTFAAHVKNAIVGVQEGYSRKLKILYAHFPMSIEIKGSEILIKNFMGEKQPRRSKIVGSTKVEVKGQEIFVNGTDKDDVGQTIANMRTASKIRDRDSRVFQDGIYPVDS